MKRLCVYKVLLQSKVYFGGEFYSFASDTPLKFLNCNQNATLRICHGARQTSPVSSNEVVKHILTPALAQEKIIMSVFTGFRLMPVHLNVIQELSAHFDEQVLRQYTVTAFTPLFVRCHKLLKAAYLEVIECVSFPLVNLALSWKNQAWINPFLAEEPILQSDL